NGLWDAARDLGRDGHDAVLIEVDDVAGLDPHAADLDGNAEVHHVDVGVRDGDVRGGKLELERAHLVEIADGSVGHDADTAKRRGDIRLRPPPLGALPARLVDVVDDDDSRGGDAHDEVPPAVEARAMTVDGAVLGADHARGGVSHEGAQLGEEPADL